MIDKLRTYLAKRKIKRSQKPIIGKVIHYYSKKSVAVIKILTELQKDDSIIFVNKHNREENFNQKCPSIWHHEDIVDKASKGMEVSIKTKRKARKNMIVLQY